MSSRPIIFFHDDCPDGFGAAFSAWCRFGNDAEYVPAQYGRQIPDLIERCRGKEVYIVDFAFPRDITQEIMQASGKTVWLDHHKSAFEQWTGDGQCQLHKECIGNVEIVLDNSRSGALITWDYFFPDVPAPIFIRHIDDNDRWVFAIDKTREFSSALSACKPWTFDQWDWMHIMAPDSPHAHRVDMYEAFIEKGAILLAAKQKMVEDISRNAVQATIEDRNGNKFTGLLVNSVVHHSEIGARLFKKSGTLGATWYMNKDGIIKVSLRSADVVDVAELAATFGGGGHKNAAGCVVPLPQILQWIAREEPNESASEE